MDIVEYPTFKNLNIQFKRLLGFFNSKTSIDSIYPNSTTMHLLLVYYKNSRSVSPHASEKIN